MRQRVLQALALQKRLCRIVRPHGACACGASCAEMQAAFVLSVRAPHPSRYSLDTFSRLGEGFYSYALCKKLGCSAQLPQSAMPDFRTQSRPVAGENLVLPGLKQASPSQPFAFFPYGLASPARADCIGVPRGWLHLSLVSIERPSVFQNSNNKAFLPRLRYTSGATGACGRWKGARRSGGPARKADRRRGRRGYPDSGWRH